MEQKYPLFSKKNIPGYNVVMGLWLVISILIAVGILFAGNAAIGWKTATGWSLVSVMAGMGIMFAASAANLRTLRPGFERLASGERNPRIDPVWCPVLTMATRAAVELNEKLLGEHVKIERRNLMEKIEKLVNDFKALTNEEKLAFMKEAMPYMAEIFKNDPQKMMAEMMPVCMNMMKSKGMYMDTMRTMMKNMMG